MGTIYSADCHTCPLRLSSPWSIVAERSRAPLAMAKMLDQVMMPATGVARGIRVPSVVHRVTNKVMELVSAKHLHCTPGGYFVAIDVEPELLDKGVDAVLVVQQDVFGFYGLRAMNVKAYRAAVKAFEADVMLWQHQGGIDAAVANVRASAHLAPLDRRRTHRPGTDARLLVDYAAARSGVESRELRLVRDWGMSESHWLPAGVFLPSADAATRSVALLSAVYDADIANLLHTSPRLAAAASRVLAATSPSAGVAVTAAGTAAAAAAAGRAVRPEPVACGLVGSAVAAFERVAVNAPVAAAEGAAASTGGAAEPVGSAHRFTQKAVTQAKHRVQCVTRCVTRRVMLLWGGHGTSFQKRYTLLFSLLSSLHLFDLKILREGSQSQIPKSPIALIRLETRTTG